ncbi:hypothetical protein MCOR25_003447 [Pyricularia grisea]|uniref:DUF4484 domain-containing protein n=1 Tax=Pyricularia grisea TaxID=148305 RepID=A0A6P8AR92_PYRGI|nr:uncharacterized protein PgNI_09378 [Pyricularia grisea]KAI6373677.1 hypothetical protein MCOR25_003447 [Pyricularia grisea]TLD04638.1 hypothetical protein PgNI_09378 [Pyricularia grisea]
MTSRPTPTPISVPKSSLLSDLPPVSALFLIEFDVKAGYTITWKKAAPGINLDGTVEYKSLPSGLHTVSQDLIYFIHEGEYAGLSAFVNAKTEEEATRNARMIAVGVLVPLSYGRLGRSWRHAEGLRDMAIKLAVETKDLSILETYWEKNKAHNLISPGAEPPKESPPSSPSVTFQPSAPQSQFRKRTGSDAQAFVPPGHQLSPFHPAWSLSDLLDTFGPLIFPIHRAALLRKRILISTHAPVHQACDFVYDISILSNIPLSLFDLLEPTAPAQRLRPLFNIGVNDIAFLSEDAAATISKKRCASSASASNSEQLSLPEQAAGSGWVACTTDSILAMKPDLWDMLITMPAPHAAGAKERVWPTIELPGHVPVRATQRDLRRFRNLRVGITRLARPMSARSERPGTSSGWSAATAVAKADHDSLHADAVDKVVEPTTWAALAYSGFMWWASAGEQRRSGEAEEVAQDSSLLADLASAPSPRRRGSSVSGGVSGHLVKNGAVMADSVMSLPATGPRNAGDRVTSGASDMAAIEASSQQSEQGVTVDHTEEERARVELAIIAYFRRLTTQMLTVLGDLVDSIEDGDDEEMDETETTEDSPLNQPDDGDVSFIGSLHIDSDALARMGLDVWSDADVGFVKEATACYFARRARVESKAVEVCGLRVC